MNSSSIFIILSLIVINWAETRKYTFNGTLQQVFPTKRLPVSEIVMKNPLDMLFCLLPPRRGVFVIRFDMLTVWSVLKIKL